MCILSARCCAVLGVSVMKKPLALAAGLGFLLAVFLIVSQGTTSVLGALASVGIGALWITLIRCLQVFAAGWAWWTLIPSGSRELLKACLGLRYVREAINTLLPVAQIGGEVVGARLLTRWHVDGGLAGATVLVDLLIQTATLVVFSSLGVLLLALLGGRAELIFWISLGLLVMGSAVTGFFLAQRMGGFRLLEHAFLRLGENSRWTMLGGVANLHHGLQAIHVRRGAIAVAALAHLIVWFIGAIEIWIALAYLGYPVGYMEALAIESLGQAVRAAGFLIPGGLGVQEGGFVGICAVVGIPAPAAIALSLVKRVPEVLLGLPGLLAWRVLEGRADDGALARLENAR
jgi:putative membrane protein